MDHVWDEIEILLLAQQQAGTTIDSVIEVGAGKDDKIIVKGRPGAFKVVPHGVAQLSGLPESAGHTTIREAVAVARVGAKAYGLRALRARFGRGKNPATQADRTATPTRAAVDRYPRATPAGTSTRTPPAPGVSPLAGARTGPSASLPAEDFVALAREQLNDILDVSGQVLYSGASTLCKGELYLLGLNPGGDPASPALLTIRRSLDNLVSSDMAVGGVQQCEWNSYVHATWKGRDTLQRRILWLLRQLGHDPLSVAASNLIFPRSRDEASLQYERYADACWAVHERVLDIVQPRWVLTYGNTPYRFLRDRLGASSDQRFPAGHAGWECRSFDVPGRFRVVGVPHMSLYAIDHHPEVVAWIKGL